MDNVDEPTDVRNGEELDAGRIEAFLKDTIDGLDGTLRLQQFPCGASNLTYLVTCGNREMVLRRPPFGTRAATAHDMGREYKVLSALSRHWPYAPKPLVYAEDDTVIGSPFYVMERCRGIILRRDIPAGILTGPGQVRALYERFVEVLRELHSLDYRGIGLADLGRPEGYVMRQVRGWSRRYLAARTPDMPDFEKIMGWLEEKMPSDTRSPGIIHNDFKLDNVVLDPAEPVRITGVLDWEMATIGDPLMDLGSTLGYWVEKDDPPERHLLRSMPTHVDGAPGRRELVDLYSRLSGIQMDRFDFYYCFGLFRLAVIIQQLYYRYYHGQTRNRRFKRFAAGLPVLQQAAERVIAQSDL